MKLEELGEFGFIERIQNRFSSSRFSNLQAVVPLGIGDDAAAVIPSAQKYTLLTTDTLIEGIHFDRAFSSFQQVGYKALAVNISDIAAMGGSARFFLISLGLPDDIEVEDLNQLYRGIAKGSQAFETVLIGGNTSATNGPFFVTITLVGEVDKKEMVRRDGAKIDDALYVTGNLGDAAAGLDLLRKKLNQGRGSKLAHRHQTPSARLREGRLLAKEEIPSAMIDLSDGLTADLGHIMQKSGVGAELVLAQMPISASLKRYVKKYEVEKDVFAYALYGGEDYELLFSVSEKKLQKLEQLIKKGLIQACRIGTILPKKKGLILRKSDGITQKIIPGGYDHFKRNPNPEK